MDLYNRLTLIGLILFMIPGQSETLCSTPMFCDFEVDQCSWNQFSPEGSRSLIWERTRDIQNLAESRYGFGGLINKYRGYFLNLDLNNLTSGDSQATVISVWSLPVSGCFTFFYRLTCRADCSLSLTKETKYGRSQVLFLKRNTQSYGWIKASTPIEDDSEFRLAFTGHAQSRDSVVSLDNFKMEFNKCPELPTCDLETENCLWNWKNLTRVQGKDHTTGSHLGHYLEIDQQQSHSIELEPPSSISSENCLTFWTSSIETISLASSILAVRLVQKDRTKIWVSDQVLLPKVGWTYHRFNLTPVRHAKIIIELTQSGLAKDRVAIDDISLQAKPCERYINCNFEYDSCGWEGAQWKRNSGLIPSLDLKLEASAILEWIPHGWYMLLQGKDLPPGGAASLSSPEFSLEGEFCLRFGYFLAPWGQYPVDAVMTVGLRDLINMESSDLAQINLIWREGEEKLDWIQFEKSFNIRRKSRNMIVIQIVQVFLGDIAIDDISISDGMCSQGLEKVSPESEWNQNSTLTQTTEPEYGTSEHDFNSITSESSSSDEITLNTLTQVGVNSTETSKISTPTTESETTDWTEGPTTFTSEGQGSTRSLKTSTIFDVRDEYETETWSEVPDLELLTSLGSTAEPSRAEVTPSTADDLSGNPWIEGSTQESTSLEGISLILETIDATTTEQADKFHRQSTFTISGEISGIMTDSIFGEIQTPSAEPILDEIHRTTLQTVTDEIQGFPSDSTADEPDSEATAQPADAHSTITETSETSNSITELSDEKTGLFGELTTEPLVGATSSSLSRAEEATRTDERDSSQEVSSTPYWREEFKSATDDMQTSTEPGAAVSPSGGESTKISTLVSDLSQATTDFPQTSLATIRYSNESGKHSNLHEIHDDNSSEPPTKTYIEPASLFASLGVFGSTIEKYLLRAGKQFRTPTFAGIAGLAVITCTCLIVMTSRQKRKQRAISATTNNPPSRIIIENVEMHDIALRMNPVRSNIKSFKSQ